MLVRDRRKQAALAKRRRIATANFANFGDVMRAIADLADAQAYAEALGVADAAAQGPHRGERGEFLQNFARLAMAVRVSSHDDAVAHAEKLLASRSPSLADLENSIDAAIYERLIAGVAMALTRVGRYADAKLLLAEMLNTHPGSWRIRQTRAEIAWPHDPELALGDLVALEKAGQLGASDALLYAYLELRHPDSPNAGKITGGRSPELPLVKAIEAHDKGNSTAFTAAFNGLFSSRGLAEPMMAGAPFSFATLRNDAAPAPRGPLVSVIMTTFNAEATLRYAVDSILNQSYRDLELFIVDDASTDGTRAMLAQIAKDDPRVQIILNEINGGTYVAKNRAMQVARGAYITFHDSDDWAHPQRIERHVAAMQRAPDTMMTRSNWLRLTADGEIEFCRWGKRFAHPNPASMFVRRELVDKIGYFDSVRVSADTEYRLRARTMFGPGAIVLLREVLALGALHEASLTQSGEGALDIEKYSRPRSEYASAYWQWYVSARPQDLYIGPEIGQRPFPAPASMLPHPVDATIVNPTGGGSVATAKAAPLVFGISLASKQASPDWGRTTKLLSHTLDSLLAQSNPEFEVVVCGHDRPGLDQFADGRIRFIESDIRPPADPRRFREDKMRKRRLIGSALREMGGGYFYPLDADDLVHREFVAHIRNTDNRRGYVVVAGYALDFAEKRLAPIPGVWKADFNRVCGSSALLYFLENELPVGGENEDDLYFNLFQSHAYWPVVAQEHGRPLDDVPFAAAVYVLNHAQNLSFGLQRKGDRTANILASLEQNALGDGMEILRDQFGWRD
jgi:hypothetical protein